MGQREAAQGAAAVELFVRPKSIAIVGMSAKPGSPGRNMLSSLLLGAFAGAIHLVGRSGGEIEGRQILTDIDQLPDGVDLAIFCMPAAGACEAMEACARRGVRAAVLFASGFAEVGERDLQDRLARIAAEGGIALLGPNCLGYTNFVDGLHVGFVAPQKIAPMTAGPDPALAIISHSGGLMAHLRLGLAERDLPVAYTINTGNEAGVGLADFVDFLAGDALTRTIIVYVEEVREPQAFLAAARRARAAGKPVLMMHPGRSARAQEATMSHTGALAGDHAAMRAVVERAGVLFLDNLDELIDAAEILARFPAVPTKGAGVVTFSGAFCAIAHDFCEEVGLDLPDLSPHTVATLRDALPAFATPRNPLDLTTQPVWQPDLMRIGPKALLDDPQVGSLVISITLGTPRHGTAYLEALTKALEGNSKPVVFSLLGDRSPLPEDFIAGARAQRIILSRSAERSLRAMARVTEYGRALARLPAANAQAVAPEAPELPDLAPGAQPEWLGKAVLRAIGARVPDGALARDANEAARTAQKIGYPVAMKAQAAALAHKTEAGGVLLNIADEAGVRAAFERLRANVERAQPGLALDGVLVEQMSKRGLELVVGAKRDPRWGPVLVIGLGGTLVEALGDVRVLAPDLTPARIVEEFGKLKAARLLGGFRGSPPADVEAAADIAAKVAQLMRAREDIVEIDVNPVMAHPRGEGATALDALIIVREEASA